MTSLSVDDLRSAIAIMDKAVVPVEVTKAVVIPLTNKFQAIIHEALAAAQPAAEPPKETNNADQT